MQAVQLVALSLVVIAIALLLYFQLAGKRDQVAIINADGGRVVVNVELADTMAKRAKGLMFRDSLGENEGMLFVFGKPGYYGFWMVNTTIPLDAIFFSSDGSVVDVIGMEPCGLLSCQQHVPRAEAQYVLEANMGFAARNGIEIGKSRAEYFPKR